jgi:hypothetical protein
VFGTGVRHVTRIHERAAKPQNFVYAPFFGLWRDLAIVAQRTLTLCFSVRILLQCETQCRAAVVVCARRCVGSLRISGPTRRKAGGFFFFSPDKHWARDPMSPG